MTVYEVVLEEAAKFNLKPAEDEIEDIVWSHTGYPSFWPDQSKTPEENFRMQLQEYFSKNKK
jgi:hypothetical protein